MKKIRIKVIAALIAGSTIFSMSTPVMANPTSEELETSVATQQEEYREIEEKINSLHFEIDEILDEITTIMVRIEETDEKILAVETKKAETQNTIYDTQVELDQKTEEYGQRLRAMYKQGNSGMISAIIGSESIADFIARAEAIIKFAKIDRQLLDEIETIRTRLEEEKNVLEADILQLETLNAENAVDMAAAEVKKEEADEKLMALEEEERKIIGDLSALETMMISVGKAIINDSSSSDDQINAAITELRNVRSKIITDTADAEVVKYIEKGKSILNERRLDRERAAQRPSSNSPSSSTAPSVSSSAVVNKAYQYLGIRYVWGGSTPNGFDCSGLTQYVYRSQGVNIPRVASAQANVGSYVSIANAQAGDLLYFGNSSITHVGIYIGNNKMIHAPRPGKNVEIVDISWHVRNYRIVGARRI